MSFYIFAAVAPPPHPLQKKTNFSNVSEVWSKTLWRGGGAISLIILLKVSKLGDPQLWWTRRTNLRLCTPYLVSLDAFLYCHFFSAWNEQIILSTLLLFVRRNIIIRRRIRRRKSFENIRDFGFVVLTGGRNTDPSGGLRRVLLLQLDH